MLHVPVCGFDLEIDADRMAESGTEVRRQVREYDRGERESFDLHVGFPETFTGRMMEAMAAIPHGETRTYSDLGTASAAIGSACGRNPVPVVVPCHRVVGAGSLGGFSAGGGVEAKRALLDHERVDGSVQSDLGAFR